MDWLTSRALRVWRCAYDAASVSHVRKTVIACLLLCCAVRAHATITVLVGEPFGSFGRMMPVGHTAIYLDHVCADGPLKLRACRADEPAGVVIARYHQIGRLDWIATPIMQFLYATSTPAGVLPWATPEDVWALRQQYRRRYMLAIVPDGTEKAVATDEWWETAGVAYNRRLWGYSLDTTSAEDTRIINAMNADHNIHRYRLSDANCANFAADLINFIYPHAVRRTSADLGWMTPKQVAHCVWLYGRAHPELHPAAFEVPQVPGTLVRSRHAWGASEGLLKTKTYVATLLIIQPEVPALTLALWLAHGRFALGKGAVQEAPVNFDHSMEALQASTGTGTSSSDADQ